ncbi:diacylglycerol O-acyltransferase 1-2-like [Silene latifolia]|uniref:diacylglycerol O-acyltransferase 1-2-like n=1 Tax=Silene latifolia TaxID=37657 RepID=UPI003D7708CB
MSGRWNNEMSSNLSCCHLEGRLNILVELLMFGDLKFYKDWWNARTFEEVYIYFKLQGMPIDKHEWVHPKSPDFRDSTMLIDEMKDVNDV